MKKLSIEHGDIFSSWKVIGDDGVDKHGKRLISCQCICGTTKSLRLESLSSGKTTQCRYCSSKKHGMHSHPLYKTWSSMKSRCLNIKDKDFVNYGGRGITVCERWKDSFSNFYEDMGEKPSPKYSIDRIDNDGDYKPSNCKWSTSVEQNNNTRTAKIGNRNTSGFIGVCQEKSSGMWRARITRDSRRINLGSFRNKIDAIEAVKSAKKNS